jgi:long-chain fatty acid transport protein
LAAAGSAKATIKIPDSFIISTSQTLDEHWEMLGDLSWTGWSKIDQLKVVYSDGTPAQTLDTRFRNTWRVALGANYVLSDAWKLKFGIAYDQTPIRDSEHRLVSLPDNNRYWFSIGGQWKPCKVSTLDLGLAYLYIKDAEINNDQTANLRGQVNGSFSDSAWILGAQYSMSF